MDIVKFIFHPHSVEGLEDYVELWAHNYIEAKHRVSKYVYLEKTKYHPLRGKLFDGWEQEKTL